MSTSIGQYGDSGAFRILDAGIDSMTQTQENLSWETSAGTLSETYAGLGSNRTSALSITPQITQVEAWQNNVTNAQNSLTVSATAVQQIVSLAQNLNTNILSITGSSSSSTISDIATQAQSALTDLGATLNTSDGTGYVFAGQDSTEPPLTNASSLASGSLATAISAAVSTLGTSGASSVMTAATDAANSNIGSVFSSSLTTLSGDETIAEKAASLQKSVLTGSNTATEVGIVATQGSGLTSTSPSTGSPIYDLMRDMMVVSSMSGMSSSTSGYSDLVSQLHTSLQSTIAQLTDMESSVGVTQDNLTSQTTLLSSMQSMMTTQLSNARDADIAAVATQTSALNTRLQASYTLVSDMKSMSLADYI
ncbi:flagellin [Komagataeibacter sp. FNDCR2]|uniref:flagellin n=1 Tax=Komagataeibacter sp. FNDCR2 TaxID=2878682 RepID=UPI001E374E03|nr:flagellin [Komagataeibacter sp. FNDCR2]MCE2576806.1 flagellin [Komagataeibacter sp. FNDCR2]